MAIEQHNLFKRAILSYIMPEGEMRQSVVSVFEEEEKQAVIKLDQLRRIMREMGAIGVYRGGEQYGSLSARIQDHFFVCPADETSRHPKMKTDQYLVVTYDEQMKSLNSLAKEDLQAPPEAMIHDGFYRGNSRIQCVASGHFLPINYHYSKTPQKSISIQGENILKLREAAKSAGSDERILMHNVDEILFNRGGHYGIALPKDDEHGFYIAGESVEDVISGLLISGNTSLGGMMNFFNRELSEISCYI